MKACDWITYIWDNESLHLWFIKLTRQKFIGMTTIFE